MSALSRSLWAVGGLILVLCAVYVYWHRQVQKPAKGNPAEFLRQPRAAPGRRVVVCLGASIVHGRVSVDFVELLRRQFAGSDTVFVNAGRNGDLAYNVLTRLDPVIACTPDAVIILVGTNDVQCTLDPRIARLLVRGKRLPVVPTLDWYRANLEEIVARLKQETHAAIALASLPVLGEELDSLANARIRTYNAVIQQVAAQQGVAYLPVHERQEAYLLAHPATPGRTYAPAMPLVMVAALQHFLLGWSFDAIAQRNGLQLTTDLFHMNSRGAAMIADLVEGFLRQPV
jgi:lysophospholipase L1-like esterase